MAKSTPKLLFFNTRHTHTTHWADEQQLTVGVLDSALDLRGQLLLQHISDYDILVITAY